VIRFLEYVIEGRSPLDVYGALQVAFPDIDWRRGDSDAQGLYIKGYHHSGLDIAFWLGERPDTLTIDARHTAGDADGLLQDIDHRLCAFMNSNQITQVLVKKK